jgi:V/A-type H+-transporting ATPase subunit A
MGEVNLDLRIESPTGAENPYMAEIIGINGPVVKADDPENSLKMLEKVFVGDLKLIGEVIKIIGKTVTVQVYEDTGGIKIGEGVTGSGAPLSLVLGPGLMSGIYDGILRPLTALAEIGGDFIQRGMEAPSIDLEKKWELSFKVSVGEFVSGGDVFAEIKETSSVTHRALIPPYLSGRIKEIVPKTAFNATEKVLAVVSGDGTETEVALSQKWPIRTARPVVKRMISDTMLLTGQRIVDTFFPILKGGAAAIPGGFGTGKTMTQHQLAKWSDADIIVYIGCGERGNEMTQVLEEFSELTDPRTDSPLTDRTILIANTSNMPVAAREASIYTGITLAEYYRDMGYNVAIMADSTSRWAEALREISGRLEEMPAEEGFPAYLSSRLSEFYERAGYCENLNNTEGSVTIIGAVSPQGGDFSEPVTQNTMRYIRCFWALDRNLAYMRHYPAINWLTSYSEYTDYLEEYYAENAGADFVENRNEIMTLLAEDNKLMEIVKLVGSDILPDSQKLVLETAKIVRSGYLQQNAYNEVDTYVPLKKQALMLKAILLYYSLAKAKIESGITFAKISDCPAGELLIRMKYDIKNENLEAFSELENNISRAFEAL